MTKIQSSKQYNLEENKNLLKGQLNLRKPLFQS